MSSMHYTKFEDKLDSFYGKVGTPKRDEFERRVADAVYAYKVGEAIRNAREKEKLTQEELGKKIGVKKAQISKMEHGFGISLPSISRVFRALGVSNGFLDLGNAGRVALW